ncbi:AMP-binding protein [Paeniglutamicibacter cryotolerans]|uniref:Long-subunit acyl-CoA synthetase (AMP-forming) n=1 Tax=Paeniglutamicibacter cryotolerans TaxID=670079 RepID=A0A839QHV2_9MICC|nr:AMP-binding protein [Paeniglutamicibacter cryotolerans]MBB2995958.1 long-subunit acyl-CoA synthetase (AMP-forming) [Paeniglutamicibacter cryotolerans]
MLGGSANHTLSGASQLNADLTHVLRGAGIGLLEGYGLPEATAPATVNMAGAVRVGSVGLPIPGTTIRIARDGEVLIKGIGVFAGHHGHPEAAAPAFTDDGFFMSGDIGTLDDDGLPTITGRKQDILVTAGGKNVAPEPLEELVRASRLLPWMVVGGGGADPGVLRAGGRFHRGIRTPGAVPEAQARRCGLLVRGPDPGTL